MSKKPNNPKAFPCHETASDILQGEDYPRLIEHTGMTLRDYFAAKVMPYVLEREGFKAFENSEEGFKNYSEEFARKAYVIADAMLKQREL